MQFRSARFVRLRLFVVPVLLAVLAPALPAVAQDVPGDFGMFLPVGAAGSEFVGLAARSLTGDPLVVRARLVGIDFEAFAPLTAVLERGAALPVLRLNLFENVVVESLVESLDLTASGYSWSGGVADDPMGSVAVAVNGDVVSGVVRTLGRVYMIRSEGSGQYSIREVNRAGLPEGAPPLVPRSLVEADPAPAAFVDDPGRVDIAVFYTTAAQRDAGGTDQINTLIDVWIADTNGAYLRSDIQHRLNLVLREQVSYTEGEDSEDSSVAKQAIDCLSEEDDGCLDAIHATREKYSADLVHLIVSGPSPSTPTRVCGIAKLTGNFGVSHLHCGSDTFAHEIGHNSGVNHDRYVEYDEECDTDTETPCFTDFPSAYAYGYVNQLGLNSGALYEHRWRTMMAYGNQCADAEVYCPTVMRFSNPDQSWLGDWLGVYGTTSRSSYSDAAEAARVGPADAARTHREFAHDLANRMVRKAPDLVVKGLQANRLQAVPGALVRLSAVVENLGIFTGYTPETAVMWCRVSPTGCSSSVGVPASVPYLESNGRAPVSTSFKLPSTGGSYSYRACVSFAPGETLTENNCSETVTVEVGVVDLQFSMSLSTYSALASAEVTITGVVRNRGMLPSGAGQLLFVTRDSAGELDWFGPHLFPTIAAGTSATFETTFEAPSVAGNYIYAACLSSPHVEWTCLTESLAVVSTSVLEPR